MRRGGCKGEGVRGGGCDRVGEGVRRGGCEGGGCEEGRV